MATTTFRRDWLWRKIVTPASDAKGFDGTACTSTQTSDGHNMFATVRANSTAYSLGQYVERSNGILMVCTVAGTSAASEPAAPGYDQTVADGTATFRQVTTS